MLVAACPDQQQLADVGAVRDPARQCCCDGAQSCGQGEHRGVNRVHRGVGCGGHLRLHSPSRGNDGGVVMLAACGVVAATTTALLQ